MRRPAACLILFAWFAAATVPRALADESALPPDHPAQVLQDPASHVTYYVDADRTTVSAFGADGKMLWRTVIFSAQKVDGDRGYIEGLSLEPGASPEIGNPKAYLTVYYRAGGSGAGAINKKTGAYHEGSEEL